MNPVITHLLTMTLIYEEEKLGNNVFQVSIRWEHEGWEDPDFYGWRVYYSIEPEKGYKQLGQDILYSGGMVPEFFAHELVDLQAKRTACHFYAISVSPPGLTESEPSNKISVMADFENSSIPVLLRVTVAPRLKRGSLEKGGRLR